jgi:oligopeptide transport system ATP-binding protein
MNLNVEKLTIAFSEVSVVRDVSFSLKQGEALAIVGESGCGKTITAQALLQLLPSSAQIKQGRILLNDVDLLQLPEKEMRDIRGKEIGMIFQDPMSALNPSMKIGLQIAETMIYHRLLNRSDALKRSEELLRLVGIPEPALLQGAGSPARRQEIKRQP